MHILEMDAIEEFGVVAGKRIVRVETRGEGQIEVWREVAEVDLSDWTECECERRIDCPVHGLQL